MSIEIERRFLVKEETWKKNSYSPKEFRQGYLASSSNGWTIRIRILGRKKAWLTMKLKSEKISNQEFEYSIPIKDAEEIWEKIPNRIHKTRYSVDFENKTWVIDCFHEANHPLVLAEIELNSKDEIIVLPNWCGAEISGQYQWSNAYLAKHPIKEYSIQKRLLTQIEQEGHSIL